MHVANCTLPNKTEHNTISPVILVSCFVQNFFIANLQPVISEVSRVTSYAAET